MYLTVINERNANPNRPYNWSNIKRENNDSAVKEEHIFSWLIEFDPRVI